MQPEPRATSPTSLREALAQARLAGLRYAYTGNLGGDGRQEDTLCPECGHVAIARHGFTLQSYNLQQGKCTNCQTLIAGVFPQK